MSAVADLLLCRGFTVSGSDISESVIIDRLRSKGARIAIAHDRRNLGDAQVAVYSSAIPPGNPEIEEAELRHIPLVHRSELLSELMRTKKAITVTGSHGKTTTAAMITAILCSAGLDPSAAIGADVQMLGGNAISGSGDHFVIEADESDRSFLRYHPFVSVVTNIDLDHTDEYRDLSDLKKTFLEHMNSVPFYGSLVICLDNAPLRAVSRKVHRPVLTYGLIRDADFSAREIRYQGFHTNYQLYRNHKSVGQIQLRVPGRHNVLNSLAAIATGWTLGIRFEAIRHSLEEYSGADRRLEWKGEKEGVWVLDDYGHHPAEIQATLAACCEFKRRIVLVFQPHRYSRTRDLMGQLSGAFELADELYIVDIYGAGERPIEEVTSEALCRRISGKRRVEYAGNGEDLPDLLKRRTRKGDLLLTMGAGDVFRIGEAFLGKD
jgi:UDP-N-acetylmuramate--alanine ligase